jgi:hypothetical protein
LLSGEADDARDALVREKVRAFRARGHDDADHRREYRGLVLFEAIRAENRAVSAEKLGLCP